MTSKLTNPRTKICAMCRHWNGPVGGLQVKPKVNSPNFFILILVRSKLVISTILFEKHGPLAQGGRRDIERRVVYVIKRKLRNYREFIYEV